MRDLANRLFGEDTMGITIHYRGTIDDVSCVEEMEDLVVDLVFALGGKATIWRSYADDDATRVIRGLMIEAAQEKGIRIREVSFKGSIQALRQWEPHLNQGKLSKLERARLIQLLYESIADKMVVDRPGRGEPRAVKRRPKPFQLLNKPRHEMIEIKHRSRHRANRA